MNNTVNNTEYKIAHTQGKIKGLVKQLSKLAAHPDSKSNGAQFISLSSCFQPAAEYDGMLGSMLAEGFLGSAFADVASNDNSFFGAVSAIDNNLIDAADQFLEDGDKTHNNFGRGRGSIALYERAPLSKMFADLQNPAMVAYQQDLGARVEIETSIADLMRELDGLVHDAQYSPLELSA